MWIRLHGFIVCVEVNFGVTLLPADNGGRRNFFKEKSNVTNLPSCGAVAVPLILEIRDVLHHPLVDLRQGQPLIWRRGDGLRYQVRVAQIAPGVPPAGVFLGGHGRRRRRHGHGALVARLLARLHVVVGSRQRPRVGAGARLRLEAVSVLRHGLHDVEVHLDGPGPVRPVHKELLLRAASVGIVLLAGTKPRALNLLAAQFAHWSALPDTVQLVIPTHRNSGKLSFSH